MYLVCGEALFDMFMEDDGADGAVRFDARVGGSPFNVSIGISRLGGKASLLTGVSDDALGQRLVSTLTRENVHTGYLIRSGRRTTLSMVMIDETGHPDYAFYGVGSADCSVRPEDIPRIGEEIQGFHFGSYSIVVEPVANALALIAKEKGDRFLSLDPNVRPTVEPDLDKWRQRTAEFAKHANLLKISREDLDILYPGRTPEALAVDWIENGVDLVVVTDGGRQVFAWSRAGHELNVPAQETEVVDSVGAGDSFQAAVLTKLAQMGDGKPIEGLSMLDGQTLRDLLHFGCAAAALTCGRRGANLPILKELIGVGVPQ